MFCIVLLMRVVYQIINQLQILDLSSGRVHESCIPDHKPAIDPRSLFRQSKVGLYNNLFDMRNYDKTKVHISQWPIDPNWTTKELSLSYPGRSGQSVGRFISLSSIGLVSLWADSLAYPGRSGQSVCRFISLSRQVWLLCGPIHQPIQYRLGQSVGRFISLSSIGLVSL